MPTVQPLSAPKRAWSFFAGSPLLAAASKLPIVVDVLYDNSASADCLYALLQALFPEALIIPFASAQAPADIVFYDANAISRAHSEVLTLYRSHGAVLVPIAEFAEDIPQGLRHAAPLLLHPPVTRESLIEIIEPIRNHLAVKWLQRGMEELVQNIAPHAPSTKETSLLLTFPTVRGEEVWDARTITAFESEGDETVLYAEAQGKSYKQGEPYKQGRISGTIVFMRLGAIEAYLEANTSKGSFVRVHKSAVVHLRHLHSAVPTGGGTSSKDLTLHLTGGRTCPCSRTYKTTFLQAMADFAEKEGGSWKKQGGLWKRG